MEVYVKRAHIRTVILKHRSEFSDMSGTFIETPALKRSSNHGEKKLKISRRKVDISALRDISIWIFVCDIPENVIEILKRFQSLKVVATRISKTSAQHRSVLSKFVLWRLPREYK